MKTIRHLSIAAAERIWDAAHSPAITEPISLSVAVIAIVAWLVGFLILT